MGYGIIDTYATRDGDTEHEHSWSVVSDRGNRQTFECPCGRIQVDQFGYIDDRAEVKAARKQWLIDNPGGLAA